MAARPWASFQPLEIFVAETERDGQVAADADDVFGVECGEERAPVERCGRGIEKKSADGAAKKLREAAEGGLAVLAERDVFVGLKLLEPGAKAELVAAVCERDAIFVGVEIAGDAEIAAVVAAGEADAGLWV